jgi:DNA (cytosine-5)-methyltransferase 1
MLALSLFSGAGIGDIGFRAAGYKFVGFCELEGDRLELTEHNFPESKFFVGDIWDKKEEIVDYVRSECRTRGEPLKLISCTAPCQGMSKNGQGTLLKNIREGKRPKLDPRNRLIIPALWIIKELLPETVVFENVPEMRRTFVQDDQDRYMKILDLVKDSLEGNYVGAAYDVEFADYGIPQRRQRLITVYSRMSGHRDLMNSGEELIPPPTHSRQHESGKRVWVSVTEALVGFPALDAKSKSTSTCSSIPYHRVPTLDKMKYWWVSSTPPGRTAFDNQCEACGFQGNALHSNYRNIEGINQSSKTTPLYCAQCGGMLPRPSTQDADGTRRIMSGFTSSYKRMAQDLPSPTLTRNFSYACSDQKIHPIENRVLSIAEVLKLHTLSEYGYEWVTKKTQVSVPASDALIRLVIGESIPPKFLEILGRYLIDTELGKVPARQRAPRQSSLFERVT